AGAFEGPLQVNNQFPLFLTVDSPRLETATTGTSFAAAFSYSSVYMVHHSDSWTVNLDMEVADLDLRYRKNFPGLFELGIEVPVLSFSSGFMDGFLESYHSTFGFGDYGRSNRPENEFLYEVRHNGETVIRGRNGRIGIGDIRLWAKREILTGDPVVSLRVDVELPTGDASSGFGSGGFDTGVACLVNKKISEKFMSYLNIGVVFPGNLRAVDTVDLETFPYGGAGIEAGPWGNFSFLGQILFQGSPYPDTSISQIDRTAALLSFGARYRTGKNSLEFSFTEDPSTSGAPDFTLNLSYRRSFPID
ncbi:MAG: DUF3187 family protein, partial [Candidatus Sulfobium sp.]